MKKWLTAALVIALMAVVVFRALQNYRAKKEAMNRPVPEKVVPVTTIKPRVAEITEKIIVSADIQANAELALFSKVSGRIARNSVQLGSRIKPEDVVSVINRDEIGFEFNTFEVKSPVRGLVSRVLQNPGAAVTPSTPLMLVVDVDTVKAVAAVDELKIRFISRRQPALVKVQAFAEKIFNARVSNISPVCNPVTRTVDVEVSIPNLNHHLKPGMYAFVQLTESRRQAMLLPIGCLVERAGQKYVFTISAGRAQLSPVTIGAAQKDEIEIVSGLHGDQDIVDAGANLLENRDQVAIVTPATTGGQVL